MRSVEVAAKTLEEAKSLAAQQLGVDEDDLTVEVLEEPRKLLGFIGAHEVRIRATTARIPDDQSTPVAVAPEAPTATPPDTTATPAPDETTFATRAVTAANDILRLMGVQAQACVTAASPGEVCLDITGPDVALLIGRHGATLDALQLITAVIANRGAAAGVRVILDAEGYRARRQQMLERMAHSHAARAKAAGKEVVITDLKPHERRIIHLALQDDPDVETYSEGEGEGRYIVISPRLPAEE